MKDIKIGFIGQGMVGKHFADNFESCGYEVVRYSKEEPYIANEAKIKDCDVVFIAVPTSTTLEGYDASILRAVIPLVGKGKIAILKSTIYPGLTKKLQEENPDVILIHSPEFLSEATVAYDTSHPFANIVGIPKDTDTYKKAAELVHTLLPKAPFSTTVSSEEAELIKYAHNCGGYTQIIFFNLIYDLSQALEANWGKIEEAMQADPFVPNRYARPIHKSGRGAGGRCFPKDFEALLRSYKDKVKDEKGLKVLESIRDKNIELLKESRKDAEILKEVYNI
ncbi:MAG: hypothetical protein HYS51_00330 [Candidatus Zambryskibacteria bacterium]|nr:hypothetical protein [Candidatus Zambryskibacteria bacterium]